MDIVSITSWLRLLFVALPRAQGMVLVDFEYVVQFLVDIRLENSRMDFQNTQFSRHRVISRGFFSGFIMMTPQLFINYKLKSVAHLPWRMMSYKFLNTFIDDIFAFVIKMPTMYRIGCLRDGMSVIF